MTLRRPRAATPSGLESSVGGGTLRRHDLLTVPPEPWAAMIEADPDLAALPPETATMLDGWAARGWPAIVRRRTAADLPGRLTLGVPLPPRFGKLRLALSLPPDSPCMRYRVPDLRDALGAAPPSWRATLDALIDLGDRLGLVPRPFGSLLWQAVTGLPYLGPASDLDILWPVTPATDLGALLASLGALEARAPMGIDGEILLPDGGGVQWREFGRALDAPGRDVMVKRCEGVALEPATLASKRSFLVGL